MGKRFAFKLLLQTIFFSRQAVMNEWVIKFVTFRSLLEVVK